MHDHCWLLLTLPSHLPALQAQYRGPKAPTFQPEEMPPAPPALPGDAPAPLLYTGADPAVAARLMEAMWAREAPLTQAVMTAYLAAQQAPSGGPTGPVAAFGGSSGSGSGGAAAEPPSIDSESEFVEATAALARGLYNFGLTMGETLLLLRGESAVLLSKAAAALLLLAALC